MSRGADLVVCVQKEKPATGCAAVGFVLLLAAENAGALFIEQVLLLAVVLRNGLARIRIEDQRIALIPLIIVVLAEIEHTVDRSGNGVKRALNTLSAKPVVFYEPKDRALVRDGMIDEVPARPWGDHQERLATASKRVWVRRIHTRQRSSRGRVPAQASTRKRILCSLGLVDDGTHLMVVPAVGIVIHDYNRRATPVRSRLEEIDHVNHESLFIQRIRITGVAILVCRGFQQADRREVAGANRCKEICNVIVVIGRAIVANFGNGRWTSVVRIGSRRMILEKGVMRDVIL